MEWLPEYMNYEGERFQLVKVNAMEKFKVGWYQVGGSMNALTPWTDILIRETNRSPSSRSRIGKDGAKHGEHQLITWSYYLFWAPINEPETNEFGEVVP